MNDITAYNTSENKQNKNINSKMKKKIYLSEAKIQKAIKEALNDFRFDSENGEFNDYDTPQEQYRVVYDLTTKLDRTHWQTVEDGIKEFQTEQEAYDFVERLRDTRNKFYGYGVWAAKLKIERQIDTHTGESWDTVKDFSNTWLDGHDMRESKLRNMIKESVIQILKEELGDPVVSDDLDYEDYEGIPYNYFVADDGDGILNPFAADMFDEEGYLEGHEGEDGYHYSDFDIVAGFNSWKSACDYCDKHGC